MCKMNKISPILVSKDLNALINSDIENEKVVGMEDNRIEKTEWRKWKKKCDAM